MGGVWVGLLILSFSYPASQSHPSFFSLIIFPSSPSSFLPSYDFFSLLVFFYYRCHIFLSLNHLFLSQYPSQLFTSLLILILPSSPTLIHALLYSPLLCFPSIISSSFPSSHPSLPTSFAHIPFISYLSCRRRILPKLRRSLSSQPPFPFLPSPFHPSPPPFLNTTHPFLTPCLPASHPPCKTHPYIHHRH